MSTGPSTVAKSPPDIRRFRETPPPEEPFFNRQRKDEAAGYTMSFVLHLIVMLALTVTFVVEVRPGSPRTVTISTETDSRSAPLEQSPLEIVVDEPSGENAAAQGLAMLAGAIVHDDGTLPAWQSELTHSGAAGTGTSTGSPQPTGTPFELPKNAVQAGSFAAWWIPKVERYGEKVEPGQLPRVGQEYRIYVQIRVPEDRPVLKVEDLSGEIVGTDGYKQLIPDRAWVPDDDGNLVRAAGARSFLHARDGAVEIVFKVQGAGKAGIRDTIRIRSRLLNEEQVLTLEFKEVSSAGE